MDKKKKRNQIFIKICCLVISFGIWVYINNFINPIKDVELKNIPVEITNTKELEKNKLVLLPNQKYSVNIDIKGTAIDVYGVSSSKFKLAVDLSNYVVKKGENNIPVKILSKPANVNVVNSETLFVKVYIDNLAQKTVPVSVQLQGKSKEGYNTLEAEYYPKNAAISGPQSYVENVKKVIAQYNVQNLNKEVKAEAYLKAVDSDNNVIDNVTINPNKIDITIPVVKTKTVSINVQTTGQNGSVIKSITSNPNKIDISGDESALSKIDSISTEPIDISASNLNSIQAKLIVPEGIRLVNSDGIVSVSIVADKNTNKSLTVNIKNKNLDNQYTVALDNSSVVVVVSGLQSVLDKLTADNIECYLDFNSLKDGDYSLPVNLTLPDGVTKVSISIEKVHAVVKKS